MHRDSEKVSGMFGTLVIVLPSAFSGGELIAQHQHDVKTYDQARGAAYSTQYAAFYADCQHELRPVMSGHRLCLVYNLVKVQTLCLYEYIYLDEPRCGCSRLGSKL